MLVGSAARFLGTAQALTDDDLYQASALPGWTRAHVLTHLAQAADSRTELLRAARAGRVAQAVPLRASPRGRHRRRCAPPAGGYRRRPAPRRPGLPDRDPGAPPPPVGRPRDLAGSGPPAGCGAVTSLRRELEYHHVDLAAGYQPANWPDDFAAPELARVTTLMNHRADAPPMTLTRPAALHLGTSPPVDITGPPAALLAWLSGRSNGSGLHPDAAALRPSRHWPSPAASPSGHITGRCPPPQSNPVASGRSAARNSLRRREIRPIAASSARSSDGAQNGPICSSSPACGGHTDKPLGDRPD